MSEQLSDSNWFQKWNWKIVGWATVCFLAISAVNGLFSWIFDVELFQNKMGYSYIYFSVFFFALFLYFFYSKLKVNWIGTYAFGLMGLVGIPIEMWLEYYVSGALKSPWAAVGWGVIYILYGIVADLSMLLIKKLESELLVIIISSLIFSVFLLLISLIPLRFFYNPITETEGIRDYLFDNWFLMPFSIIQGVLGAILGYLLADLLKRRKLAKVE